MSQGSLPAPVPVTFAAPTRMPCWLRPRTRAAAEAVLPAVMLVPTTRITLIGRRCSTFSSAKPETLRGKPFESQMAPSGTIFVAAFAATIARELAGGNAPRRNQIVRPASVLQFGFELVRCVAASAADDDLVARKHRRAPPGRQLEPRVVSEGLDPRKKKITGGRIPVGDLELNHVVRRHAARRKGLFRLREALPVQRLVKLIRLHNVPPICLDCQN